MSFHQRAPESENEYRITSVQFIEKRPHLLIAVGVAERAVPQEVAPPEPLAFRLVCKFPISYVRRKPRLERRY